MIAGQEWQFLEVPEHELNACEFYEYARDVPTIRDVRTAWLKLLEAAKRDASVSAECLETIAREFPLIDRWPLATNLFGIQGFPEVPWRKLPATARRKLTQAIPERYEALDEDYSRLAHWYPPNFPSPIDPQSNEVTAQSLKRHFRAIGMVAFFVPAGRRSKKQLLNAMGLWLDRNPEFCAPRRDHRKKDSTKTISRLRWLAVRRLKRAFAAHSTAEALAHAASYGDGWLDASEQRWCDWERRALARRVALFGE